MATLIVNDAFINNAFMNNVFVINAIEKSAPTFAVISTPQLATEIELYPENSVITRYWNIELVDYNRAWIPRLIELYGPTLT